MASYFIAPGIPEQIHISGVPAASYILRAFLKGTSTPTNIYSDNAGTVAGTTITLDSEGWVSTSGTRHSIWLDVSLEYDLDLRDPTNTTTEKSWPNISARLLLTNDGYTNFGDVPTFVSFTGGLLTFTVPGDQSANYPVNRWMKISGTGFSNARGAVASVAYTTLTTITSYIESGVTPDATINQILAGDPIDQSIDHTHVAYPILSNEVVSGSVVVTNTEYNYGDVRRYGATGDGVTDDATAVQNAFNVVNTMGYGEVYAPAGTYLIGTKIDWPGNNITLRGTGSAYGYNSSATPRTIFKADTGVTIVFDLVQTGLAEDRTGNLLQDISVDGNSISTYGIEQAGANIFSRVHVKGCTTAGIHLANFTNSAKLIDCALISNSGYGLHVEGASTTKYSVYNTNISLNTAGGIHIQGGVGVTFRDCTVESNTGEGMRIHRPGAHTSAFSHFIFENVWFEDNATVTPFFTLEMQSDTSDTNSAPERIVFKQCRFSCSSATLKYMNLDDAYLVRFEDCNFAGSTATDAITFTTNTVNVGIIDHIASAFTLTDTQIDNALAQGTRCYSHDITKKRAVGSGSPAAAFENSWVNYSVAFTPARYWHDKDGDVCIEGAVKTGTPPSTVFTLPVGYRPTYQQTFAVEANGSHGVVNVQADGQVIITTGSATITNLDGIRFSPGG